MQAVTFEEVLRLHTLIIQATGGASGIRDENRIRSAVELPFGVLFGQEAYPTLYKKVAALGFFLCQGHGFVDGNKRIAHAAMEMLLLKNGMELTAHIYDAEEIMLSVACGDVGMEGLLGWLEAHVDER